jgi:hypothetical protein
MKVIVFSKQCGIYFPGDVAGFPEEIAAKFIADGNARAYAAPAIPQSGTAPVKAATDAAPRGSKK